MAVRCNKCGQDSPHLSDSWCLSCAAVEALAGDVRCAWGISGWHTSRAVATDIITSSVRQVRAIRRLGLAGAGRARALTPPRVGAEESRAAHSAPDKEHQGDPKPPAAEATSKPREPESSVKREREDEESDFIQKRGRTCEQSRDRQEQEQSRERRARDKDE